MDVKPVRELLLEVQPMWHYHISRPFKKMLDNGMSPGMYYCIQILRKNGNMMTMSQLAGEMEMPKQQATKLVNKMVNFELVQRVSDPGDRRVINLKLTEKALEYANRFANAKECCFNDLIEKMSDDGRADFYEALKLLFNVFEAMPHPPKKHGKEVIEC